MGAKVTFKTKRILEWVAFSFFALLLLLSGSLFFYQQTYAGKIYHRVKIADIELSGKTKQQAITLLESKKTNVLTKNVTLTAGDKSATAKVSDTGLSIDTNKSVNEAYAVGRNNKFLVQIYLSAMTILKPNSINLAVSVDEEKFNSFVSSQIPGLGIEPKNAELKIENGVLSEIPEQSGQVANSGDLAQKIISLSGNNDTTESFNIPLETNVVAPEIKIADLSSAEAAAQKYLSSNIVLNYNSQSYKPTKSDIGKWIVFSVSEGLYKTNLDDNVIKTYLTTIAKNFEIQRVDKKINAVDNSVIEEGREGLYLNKDQALKDIKNQINSQNSFSIALATTTEAPKEVRVFPAEGIVPGRFEGKYIDIDLAQQKLCQIEFNTILACYTISSGKASTPTPVGTRYIQDKNPKAWSAPYGLWMPWWNGLGGGYGIHELPEWPNGYKEGESHLGTPVSHGCVRLGVGSAQVVYDWAPIGTPVYIHK